MALNNFTYTDERNKKRAIKVKRVSVFSTGLMFKRNSSPLLFDMGEYRTFSIHSLFCPRFKALWLDTEKKVVKIIDVKPWKLNLRGEGRYLLEIPLK
ncbi:hypothetical protein CMI41_00590 [Candidatus Pacearchaeota archaeon]|nr:hypothetical protein [Candidatus Pacearchaeota archaeon]|tara:strand:- start:8875 stop:9165 length:291 start_codon:yes stop_codon:yes gene_type:complete